MGYCGGDESEPNYYIMGDHTEAISIDYDPAVVSYSEMLDYFWDEHRCDRNTSNVQYQNAVFYRDEKQKKEAIESLERRAARLGLQPSQVKTKIAPVKVFTYAEKYHQKYYIKGEVRDALDELYPDSKALADSTVATRINAYVGIGLEKDAKEFLAELKEYGLAEEIEDVIRERVLR